MRKLKLIFTNEFAGMYAINNLFHFSLLLVFCALLMNQLTHVRANTKLVFRSLSFYRVRVYWVHTPNDNNNNAMPRLFVIQFINQFILFVMFFFISIHYFRSRRRCHDLERRRRYDSLSIFESPCFINWFAWFLELFEFIISDVVRTNVIANGLAPFVELKADRTIVG